MNAWRVVMLLAGVLALGSPSAHALPLDVGRSLGQPSVPSGAVWLQLGRFDAPRVLSQSVAPSPDAVSPPASAAAPAAGRSVLGGVTAGLGLGWLTARLGLGEGFAPWLMLGLIALAVLLLLRWLRRSKLTPTASAGLVPLASGQMPAPEQAMVPRGYSPKNVGNDASARPWEHAAGQGSGVAHAEEEPAWSNAPPGFDAAGFLQASKDNFVNLQAAWDRSDIPSLRAMMTDAMLEQIKNQLAAREQASAGVVNQTDVVMLEAQLLGVEELEHHYLASVEFFGLIREEPSSGPNPFREVWNITRSKTGAAGWLVAGVQALQ